MQSPYLSSLTVVLLSALSILIAGVHLLAPRSVAAAVCDVPAGYSTIQAAIDDSGCSTISVGPGIYNENLVIARPLTIQGTLSSTTIVDGGGNFSVFDIATNDQVSLSNLTVRNGGARSGAGIYVKGSPTYAKAPLALDSVIITDNHAIGNGGGIYIQSGEVLRDEGVTINNSTIANNSATQNGGGIYVEIGGLTIKDTDIMSNSAVNGGGIHIPDSIFPTYVDNVRAIGNQATEMGGAFSVLNAATTEVLVDDDLYLRPTLMITNSLLLGNSAEMGGSFYCSATVDMYNGIYQGIGACRIENTTVQANQATDGGGIFASLDAASQVLARFHYLYVKDSEFIQNQAANDGGAVWSNLSNSNRDNISGAEIVASKFISNVAGGSGGAIHTVARLEGSLLSKNRAGANGGGVVTALKIVSSTITNNSANNGGGVFNGGLSDAGCTNCPNPSRIKQIIGSRIVSNTAISTGGGAYFVTTNLPEEQTVITRTLVAYNTAAEGGALYGTGTVEASAVFRNQANVGVVTGVFTNGIQLKDSVITQNSAYMASAGSNLTLTHTIIEANDTLSSSGAIVDSTLVNSVIIDNLGGDCGAAVTLAGVNFDGGGSCSATLSGDPLMQLIEDASRPQTYFYGLAIDSPLIDSADSSFCTLSDQFGTLRPQGDGCDIGATELTPGTFTLQPATLYVLESDGTISLTVRIVGSPILITSSVVIRTLANTATANQDFVPISQTLNFEPGELTKTIPLTLLDDRFDEPQIELFAVVLTNSTNFSISQGTVTLVLQDDDPAQTVGFAQDAFTVTETAGNAMITVALNSQVDVSQTITVEFVTTAGSATTGEDFTSVREILTFPVGMYTQTVLIPIVDDAQIEGAETVQLRLLNPENSEFGEYSMATLTILDAPTAPDPNRIFLPVIISD